jgi:hypothetical protein
MRESPAVVNPDVARVFAGYPQAMRLKVLALRALIFTTAAK